MKTYDVFGNVINKENPNYKYFVYIGTKTDVFGLNRLSEENLQKVIDAFAYGRESFIITGRRYFFNEPQEIHIFKIDVDLNPNFSLEIPGSNKKFMRFYTPDFLSTKGEEVTDEYIKGDFGWKAEVRPFGSGFVQVLGTTNKISIGLEPCKMIQDKINARVLSMTNEGAIKNSKQQSNKVFIVHGHDEAAKFEVARFIEKLGLEAIILHEQVNQGQTIIEKIENFSDVGYAIILYTPCDKGGLNQEGTSLKQRARQNVVFEHGYFTAKLGRKRVLPLVKGDIDTPGDLSGIVYTPMDIGGAWKLKITQELKCLGYEININNVLI